MKKRCKLLYNKFFNEMWRASTHFSPIQELGALGLPSQEEGINLHCPETTSLQSALIWTLTIYKSKKNAPSSANILLCPYALLVSECHQGHILECHTVHSWWAKSLDSLSPQLYECHRVLITQADCINSANMSTCSVQHNSAKICI